MVMTVTVAYGASIITVIVSFDMHTNRDAVTDLLTIDPGRGSNRTGTGCSVLFGHAILCDTRVPIVPNKTNAQELRCICSICSMWPDGRLTALPLPAPGKTRPQ